MSSIIIKIEREDLYNKVWITPLSKLAEKYEVSGNDLTKVCKK
jgi:hypothetical protein